MEVDIRGLVKDEDVISYNIPDNTSNYLASIIGEPDLTVENTVFFSTNTDDQKWYASKTNRSILIRKLSKEKRNWIYVIEHKSQLVYKTNYYILVHSVNLFIEKLAKRELRNKDKKVIAITGSVGKTTLARILNKLIESSQLIDVKRLTPLNIADFVFNKLESTTKYIIAEVGLYYSGQIGYLSDILVPHIGVITNIYDMHIGWNNLRTRSALLSDKINLLKASQIRIVSQEVFDEYVYSHFFNRDNVISSNVKYTEFVNSCNNLPKTNVSHNILELTHLILSKCSCCNVISSNDICQNIEENKKLLRFHKYNTVTNEIFVDSHSSIAGYFQAISHHWYNSITLLIFSINFPIEENAEYNIFLIKQTFQYFTKVLINKKAKQYFGKIESDKIIYIDEVRILSEIKKEKIVIIHDPKAVRYSAKNVKEWRALTTASTSYDETLRAEKKRNINY